MSQTGWCAISSFADYDLPTISFPFGRHQAPAAIDNRQSFNDFSNVLAIHAKPPPPNFASAMTPGSIDKKYVIYLGLQGKDSYDDTIFSVVPKGTFIATSAAGTQNTGLNTQTLHGFDIVRQFDFPVYADLPHPQYGNQTDERYDSNYNLVPQGIDTSINPATGLLNTPLSAQVATFWQHDARLFMTAIGDNAFFAANYTDIFGAVTSGSPCNVYIGSEGRASATQVDPNTYTWNPTTGSVTFSTPQRADSVISIDGIPQAMAPELMMKHLFCDYANWDSVAMSLEVSNTLLPTYVGGRGSSVWQIAQDIASQTAPRFVAWEVRIDEYGQICFYESRLAATPVATLVDELDLFNISYTLTSESLANVITADATSNNNQPLKSISYSVPSINYNGQRAPYQIPSNVLLPVRGMSSATAISLMNTLTAAQLYKQSRNILQMTCDILPNYLLQVGDKVSIIERSIGLSGPYLILGIDDKINLGQHTMSLRMEKANIFANFNMGLPSAVANATVQTVLTTPQSLSGKTGIISQFSINGISCIKAGNIVSDQYGNAVIPIVSPSSPWVFSITVDPTQTYDTALFHFMYMECPNSLSPSASHGGDPLTPNGPLSSAMVTRLIGFPDGTVTKAATIGAGYTITPTHTTGTNIGSEKAYIYNQIVVSGNAISLPPNYNSVTATLTNTTIAAQYLNTTTQYGIGYGPVYTGNYAWLPSEKHSYAYFVLMAVNAAGATSFLRIPFICSL